MVSWQLLAYFVPLGQAAELSAFVCTAHSGFPGFHGAMSLAVVDINAISMLRR